MGRPVQRLGTLCVYNILRRNTRLIVYQHVHVTLGTVSAADSVRNVKFLTYSTIARNTC